MVYEPPVNNDKPIRFRPSWERHWFHHILNVAQMSTCIRREAACVFVGMNHFELATGFNGVPAGEPHCSELYFSDDRRCPGDTQHGQASLGGCHAIHCEINAITKMQQTYVYGLNDEMGEDAFQSLCELPMDLYITVMPCNECALAIVSNVPSLRTIHTLEDYDAVDNKKLLKAAGVKLLIYDKVPLI